MPPESCDGYLPACCPRPTFASSAAIRSARSLRATPDIVLASTQFIGTFTLGALMAPFGWVAPSLGSLGLFALAGGISVSALMCVNRSLKLALEELAFFSKEVRILGVYPAHPFRVESQMAAER